MREAGEGEAREQGCRSRQGGLLLREDSVDSRSLPTLRILAQKAWAIQTDSTYMRLSVKDIQDQGGQCRCEIVSNRPLPGGRDLLPRDAQLASVLPFLTGTIRVVWPNQPATVDLLRRLIGIFRSLDSRQYH